jgi:serine/threonine protein kinase
MQFQHLSVSQVAPKKMLRDSTFFFSVLLSRGSFVELTRHRAENFLASFNTTCNFCFSSISPILINFSTLLFRAVESDLFWKNMDRQFERCEEIGNGHFSHVYKMKERGTDKFYAIKLVKQPTTKSYREFDYAMKLQYAMKSQHPNLVTYCSELLTPRSPSPTVVAFLMEFVEGETLERMLNRPETELPIPEDVLWGYLRDLLSALAVIHENDMVHLDVKPENVFVTPSNRLKLGDFGQMIHTAEYDPNESMEGDVRYMAPELLDQTLQRIGHAADMFSLGVMVWELATGLEVPLGGCDLWNVLRSGKIPDEQINHLSPLLKTVLSRLLSPEPFHRPSAAELLSMDVFRHMDHIEARSSNMAAPSRPRSRGRRSSQPDTQKKKITIPPTPYQPRALAFAPQSLQSNHVSSRFDPYDLDSPNKRRKRSSSTESSDLEHDSEASSSRSNSLVSPHLMDDMDVDTDYPMFLPTKNLMDDFNTPPRKN